jgi:hypothetical protein
MVSPILYNPLQSCNICVPNNEVIGTLFPLMNFFSLYALPNPI